MLVRCLCDAAKSQKKKDVEDLRSFFIIQCSLSSGSDNGCARHHFTGVFTLADL